MRWMLESLGGAYFSKLTEATRDKNSDGGGSGGGRGVQELRITTIFTQHTYHGRAVKGQLD